MLSIYNRDNPKFRKAFIRDRLDAIKAERTMLIEERDRLEQEIEKDREAKAHSRRRSPYGRSGVNQAASA